VDGAGVSAAAEQLEALAAALTAGDERAVVALGAGAETAAELAGRGGRIVASFGTEADAEPLKALPGAVVLRQHAVAGHVLLPQAGELDPGEPPEAVVVLAGFEADEVERAVAACGVRLGGSADLQRLERANDELRRANARLTRDWLGRYDTAAASVLGRYDAEAEALRAELEWSRGRIVELTEIAAHNDRMYQQERAWRDARRYHVVDWLWARAGIVRRLLGRPPR
jgi:hypothetical protein